jgi:hypothetical protein
MSDFDPYSKNPNRLPMKTPEIRTVKLNPEQLQISIEESKKKLIRFLRQKVNNLSPNKIVSIPTEGLILNLGLEKISQSDQEEIIRHCTSELGCFIKTPNGYQLTSIELFNSKYGKELTKNKIRELLSTRPNMSIKEIAEALGETEGYIHPYLKAIKDTK